MLAGPQSDGNSTSAVSSHHLEPEAAAAQLPNGHVPGSSGHAEAEHVSPLRLREQGFKALRYSCWEEDCLQERAALGAPPLLSPSLHPCSAASAVHLLNSQAERL